jgi:lysyl-tRNA synthetase class II
LAGTDVNLLNEKQLIDKLIEEKIETQCIQPSFIMNHPILMSPLAKSHALGKF